MADVKHTFAGGVSVLDGVSLEIAAGEVVALIGTSGCGKTTLLNIIAGLILPSAGTVEGWSERAGGRLGVVFQDHALLPWRNVTENVRLPLELAGLAKDSADRVGRAMTAARVEAFSSFLPGQLSGGLQSRVAIARALVNDPTLLLLDEPFGSLDEVTAEAVMFDLAEAIRAAGATAIFVTHSLEQAAFLADRVVVLGSRPGRIHCVVDVTPARPRPAAVFRGESSVTVVGQLRAALRVAAT